MDILKTLTQIQLEKLSDEEKLSLLTGSLTVNQREELDLPEIKQREPESCCDNPRVITNVDTGKVCANCGTHLGYDFARNYINYHENQWKIRKKSVYDRKYYIKNKLRKLNLTYKERTLFMTVWDLVMTYINSWMKEHNCKRMIKIDYLIMKSLQLIKPIHEPTVCKINEPTLTEYEQLWEKFIVLFQIIFHS